MYQTCSKYIYVIWCIFKEVAYKCNNYDNPLIAKEKKKKGELLVWVSIDSHFMVFTVYINYEEAQISWEIEGRGIQGRLVKLNWEDWDPHSKPYMCSISKRPI